MRGTELLGRLTPGSSTASASSSFSSSTETQLDVPTIPLTKHHKLSRDDSFEKTFPEMPSIRIEDVDGSIGLFRDNKLGKSSERRGSKSLILTWTSNLAMSGSSAPSTLSSEDRIEEQPRHSDLKNDHNSNREDKQRTQLMVNTAIKRGRHSINKVRKTKFVRSIWTFLRIESSLNWRKSSKTSF